VGEDLEAFRREVADLAARAVAEGGSPLRDGDRLLIPVFRDGSYREARFLRLRTLDWHLERLRTVYLVLLLGAAASMAVTVVALRHWILDPLEEVAAELMAVIAATAAGRPTASESLGHREFVLTYKSSEPTGPACLPVVRRR